MGRYLSAPRWEKRPPRLLANPSIQAPAMVQGQQIVMLELNTPGTLKQLRVFREQATGTATRCMLEIVIDGVIVYSTSMNMVNRGFTVIVGTDPEGGTKITGHDFVAFNRLQIRCTATDGTLASNAVQLMPNYEVY